MIEKISNITCHDDLGKIVLSVDLGFQDTGSALEQILKIEDKALKQRFMEEVLYYCKNMENTIIQLNDFIDRFNKENE